MLSHQSLEALLNKDSTFEDLPTKGYDYKLLRRTVSAMDSPELLVQMVDDMKKDLDITDGNFKVKLVHLPNVAGYEMQFVQILSAKKTKKQRPIVSDRPYGEESNVKE